MNKQETLEKAAETNSEKHHYAFGQQSEFYQIGFIEGVKWQQERRYSEEDLRKAWEDGRNNVITVGKPPFVITKFQHNSFSNWFEQFKNK